MRTQRLNIDFPSEDYGYLKMLCAQKGVSIKDFLVPVIQKAMDDEEDEILAKKAQRRLKNSKSEDFIPFDDAIKLAGWDV